MIVANIKIAQGSHKPMYRQLADGIKQLIEAGKLAPGERLPTSKELQKKFRLSAVTVESGISRLVKQNYLIRRPRLGTFVNPSQKVKSSEATVYDKKQIAGKNIRVIFCNIASDDLYWYHVLSELEKCLSKFVVNLIFTRFEANKRKRTDSLDFLLKDTQGAIVCGYISPDIVELYKKAGIPLSVIGSLNKAECKLGNVQSVVHDDVHRAYLSTSHLLELGHRSIVAVVGPDGSRLAEDFTVGYEQAMQEYGLSEKNMRVEKISTHTLEAGRTIGAKLIINGARPSAIFACDDRVAVGIINAAQKLGFEVPQELSIVGCGNLELADAITPGLTTTKSFPEKSALLAVDKLKKQFKGDPEENNSVTILRIEEMVLRESTLFYRQKDS